MASKDTTSKNRKGGGKGSKKAFGPPGNQPLAPVQPGPPREGPRGDASPGKDAALDRARAGQPEKKEEGKMAKDQGPGGHSAQGKKAGKEPEEKLAEPEKKLAEPEKKLAKPEKKLAEPKVKEKKRLSDAEFEEIFQSVLQTSLQEYLETSKRDTELEGGPEKTKEPRAVIAASAAKAAAAPGSDGDDDEREMPRTPPPPESCLPQGAKDSRHLRSFEPEPPNSATAGGKANQASSDEKKKDTDGSTAPAKPEHKPSRRGRSKKTDQDYTEVSNQEVANFVPRRSFSHSVAWVQCSFRNCEKWRRLLGDIDPSGLPDDWECSQNSDLKYNRCDIPEELWTGSESDVVYASYIPGSLVWAKQCGYPWWPGMVELDPDLGEYFMFHLPMDSLPSKYHVTFLGEVASRAWISVHKLKNFQDLSLDQIDLQTTQNKACGQMLLAALKMAQEAEPLGVQERISLFGFSIRYSRTEAQDPQEEGKQDEHPKAKEEDEPHVMEEEEEEPEVEEDKEEEKRDLTQPKPAKIPKKEPKAQAVGKKNYKPPLGVQAAATPKATAGKRGGGNRQTDLLGVKKAFSVQAPRLPAEGRGGVSSGRASAGASRERRAEAPKGPGSPLPSNKSPSDDVDLEQVMEEVVDPTGELLEEEEEEEEGEEFSLVLLEE
ncbi:zinc finger CW-type PWWP domain protein 1 isoform X2 [Tachyglossus aculeatus]|uniref:zinc finger CW-type PWWP domain protein 1 isoform X2 n=1 Tax=Tachyglossus aculeatus TaxID=9261 RepID=UPI0018F6F299|nr:zinc finger CW-type PWWP domain protein 1 isoform X2 [Tachyglossus aculeatus]